MELVVEGDSGVSDLCGEADNWVWEVNNGTRLNRHSNVLPFLFILRLFYTLPASRSAKDSFEVAGSHTA
mgnify:CR=1 FL=1